MVQTNQVRTLIVNCYRRRAALLRWVLKKRPDVRVVAAVYDGAEGLAMARQLQPDLLLTCISLKSLSGLELTSAVKRELPGIKVIIGTVQGDREQEALSAGADAFFTYPMIVDEFLMKLDAVLNWRTHD